MNKIIPWVVGCAAVLVLVIVVGVSMLSKAQNSHMVTPVSLVETSITSPKDVVATTTVILENRLQSTSSIQEITKDKNLSSVKLFEDPVHGVRFSYPTFGNNDTATVTIDTQWESSYDVNIPPKDGRDGIAYTVSITHNTKYRSVQDAFSASYGRDYITYGVWVSHRLNNGMQVLTGDGDGHLPATTIDNGDFPRDDFYVMSSSSKSIIRIFGTSDGGPFSDLLPAALYKMLESMQVP